MLLLVHMPSYHSDNNLTSLLCLICHSGKAMFIPGIIDNISKNTWIMGNHYYHPSWDTILEGDILLLHWLTLKGFESSRDPYRHFVTRFLQDPSRSGRYAVGPDTYANATLFFVQQLALLDWKELNPTLDENYLSYQLVFQDDIWRLDLSNHNPREGGITASVTPFLLLGYIIFFLPYCGKSQALVKHCQQQTFLNQHLISFFPRCTATVRQAVGAYLRRVERIR